MPARRLTKRECGGRSKVGKKAQQIRKDMERTIRADTLTDEEKQALRSASSYEGSPYHKRNRHDFGLSASIAPRLDKTLCDEAGVIDRKRALELFNACIDGGLVSDNLGYDTFPKELWLIDDEGNAFEAMYGGSKDGAYHGYPIRRSDPFYAELAARFGRAY